MKTSRELTSKKNRARYLIVVKGYSQKEAAQIVDVTEQTMVKWVEKYQWKDAMSKIIRQHSGLNGFMEVFFKYVQSAAPSLFNEIKKQWNGFLKAYEKDIGN